MLTLFTRFLGSKLCAIFKNLFQTLILYGMGMDYGAQLVGLLALQTTFNRLEINPISSI